MKKTTKTTENENGTKTLTRAEKKDAAKGLIKELLQSGASCALLSGSGPSVFGVFKDLDDAKRAKDELLQYHEDVFVCEPTKSGYEFI